MPTGTGLDKFGKEFPDRFFDVGICEQHAVTFCAGMAANGLKPVCAIYSTFLQRGFDQIVHDVCLQNLNVFFAIDRAGLIGSSPDGGDGETAQGYFDIAFMRMVPNAVVMAPGDENEMQHMVYTALKHEKGPIAVRYPRGSGLGAAMDEELKEIPSGKGVELMNGSDIAIISYGHTLEAALEAANNLKASGVSVELINARFAKPLDERLILSAARKTGQIITVEEGCLSGGFGSAVLELLEEQGVSGIKVKRIGLPDSFIEQGPAKMFRSMYKLDSQGIEETAMELLKS